MKRILAVILTSALLVPLPVLAQSPFGVPRRAEADSQRAKEAYSHYIYKFEHQKATEALPFVQRLLSSRGTVELRPAENTLMVRDSLASLTRIIPVLRRFDHPPRNLELEMLVVQAQRVAFSPAIQGEALPGHLAHFFHNLLPYSTYRVLARAEVSPGEGQEVVVEMGSGFGVSFRLGTILDGRRVRLHEFRIARRAGDGSGGGGGDKAGHKPLFQATLSLRLDQPYALALASDEASSSALMVVLTPNPSRLAREH